MNKRTKIIIALVFVAICFLGFIFVITKMIDKNSECIGNPFVYSAKALKKAGGDFSCSCDSMDIDYINFYFNETGVYPGNRISIELKGGN